MANIVSDSSNKIVRATCDVSYAFDSAMSSFFRAAEKTMDANDLSLAEMRLIIDYNCGPDAADAFEEYMEE